MTSNAYTIFSSRLYLTILRFILGIALVAGAFLANATAQVNNPNSGSTPSGLQPGAPTGSYSLSGFDNVNLYNGNLNFHLPLLGIGGRGNAKLQMMLAIDSVRWTVDNESEEGFELYTPNPNWWGGLKPGYGPGVLQARRVLWQPLMAPLNKHTVTRMTFTGPDGSEVELRDKIKNGLAYSGYSPVRLRGKIWHSTDGSSITFISDEPIYDQISSESENGFMYPRGYLFMSDGTRYRIGNPDGTQLGLVRKIRDRNGNELSFEYDVNNRVILITDSLNRQVTIDYELTSEWKPRYTYDLISYKGFGGTVRSIKIWRTTLARILRTDFPEVLSYSALFPGIGGPATIYNPPGIASSVELPDGRTYELRYNPWGDLSRVVLPTGGAFEYDFTNHPGQGPLQYIHRRISERRVYSDGTAGSLESKQQYSHAYTTSPDRVNATLKQRDANGNLLSHEKHYFEGNPADSLTIHPMASALWSDGREYKTESLSATESGLPILRRVEHVWQQSTNTEFLVWPAGLNNGPAMNPHIVETTTTLMDSSPNKVSKTTAISPVTGAVGFDKYNNQTDTWETDFGNNAPGGWLRHSHSDYLTTNDVTSKSYDTLADDGDPANPNVANTVHIRRLSKELCTFSVNPTTGADVAAFSNTKYTYDQFSLTPRENISGLDSNFTSAYAWRGNLTRTSRWLNLPTSTWINTDLKYDVAGNVVQSIDALNNTTTFYFTDRFGMTNGNAQSNTVPVELNTNPQQSSYAFVTSVSNALGHTSHSKFDFYLGVAVDEQNINGVVSSGYYVNAQGQTDPLDRILKVVTAVGTTSQSQSSFSYNDVNRIVTITSDRDTYDDNQLKTETFFDTLGRTTETHTYENSTLFTVNKKEYDALGRVRKTYNPHRTTSDPTYGWTETSYDVLGRIISVKTADNAQVLTTYDNNKVTVTNQAGKTRQSISDGLGRLIQIVEDPLGLNYQTNYIYDVLGNLRRAEQAGSQGTQYRFFMYDSLSRPIRSKNPEHSANASITPVLTDPITNQNAWSVALSYDANSNLDIRTDARNITTVYAHDALNRNTTVTYSANAFTPNIINRYDNPSLQYGKGRLWQSETTGTEGTLTTITGIDALARPLSQNQQFKINGAWSSAYTTHRSYTIAGNVSGEVYPSGHTVSYGYDDAARLSSLVGNLGDGVQRTYASTISYDGGGRMLEERLGTQTPLYHKLQYNTRSQLYDIRLSTLSRTQSITDWDRGCLAFYYSFNNPVWGGSGTDNSSNLTKAEIYVPNADWSYNMLVDLYSYDGLNRLQQVSELQWGTQAVYTQVYTYDRWGNRQINQAASSGNINTKQFSVDTSSNRLGVPSGQSGQLAFDASGNITTDTYSRADTVRTYDAENRLITNTDTNNVLSRYTYDGTDRRARRAVGSIETWQVYGLGGELLAEYDANAQPANARLEYGYRSGELLVIATNTAEVQWLISDHLGTPRMIVDKTGSLSGVKRHDYLPFGEEIPAYMGGRTPQQGYVSDSVRQKFTGKERDAETTLDYFGARYYSNIQGRFTGTDRVSADYSDPQTLNAYQYALNNPLRFVDRDGKYETDVHQDMTYVLALAVGFDSKTAWSIASRNELVDTDPKTDPTRPLNFDARAENHFTAPETRDKHWKNFNATAGVNELGIALHAEQDAWSHYGYPSTTGQLRDVPDVSKADKTYNDPNKAFNMEKSSYEYLKAAVSLMESRGKIDGRYRAVPFSALEPYIERFNKARTKKEKRKIIKEMIDFITAQRKKQAEEDYTLIGMVFNPWGCIAGGPPRWMNL